MNLSFALFAGLFCISVASATESPYKGQESRSVTSLSADEISGLRNGRGLGFAKPAEFNGYPGPKHVIDLSHKLGLTARQLEQTNKLFQTMKAEAVRLGNMLLREEKELDRMFESQSATPTSLDKQLASIAGIRGSLRAVHLKAHLQQREILTLHQVHVYDRLRGYTEGRSPQPHDHAGHK